MLDSGERVIEFFDDVSVFSRFFVRTIAPEPDPITGFLLVVVLDRPKPSFVFVESIAEILGFRGLEVGEGSFVVVKKLNTLSATMLILALALL